DAIDDRHQRKGDAHGPNEERERFSNGRRANREPGLLFFRLEQPRASPNDPKKPTRNQCEKAESRDARQQAHPCYAIEKRSSQKFAAGVFRDLIEPPAISRAGSINLSTLSRRAFRRSLRNRLRERRGPRSGRRRGRRPGRFHRPTALV